MNIKEILTESTDQLNPDFVQAVQDWQEMWNTDAAAQVILNSPESEPFRRAPRVQQLFRAIIPKDRELNAIKSNGVVVAFATQLDGAVNFVQTLETQDDWVIVAKPFNPQDCLLDYTAMVKHYGLTDSGYVEEHEVWMRPTAQYTGAKKTEVVYTSKQHYGDDTHNG